MNDFESRLTTLLDDVAGSVRVHPDPDAVFQPTVKTVPNEVHRFRPRFAAVAAAGIVLVGGSAFAMERITNDPPTRVDTCRLTGDGAHRGFHHHDRGADLDLGCRRCRHDADQGADTQAGGGARCNRSPD